MYSERAGGIEKNCVCVCVRDRERKDLKLRNNVFPTLICELIFSRLFITSGPRPLLRQTRGRLSDDKTPSVQVRLGSMDA